MFGLFFYGYKTNKNIFWAEDSDSEKKGRKWREVNIPQKYASALGYRWTVHSGVGGGA